MVVVEVFKKGAVISVKLNMLHKVKVVVKRGCVKDNAK